MQMPGKDEDESMTDVQDKNGDSQEEGSVENAHDETGEWSVIDLSEGFDPYNSGAHRFPKKRK